MTSIIPALSGSLPRPLDAAEVEIFAKLRLVFGRNLVMDEAARDRLNTIERDERFVANLAVVAAKREQKELVGVATMTDAEKIAHMEKKKHEEQKSKAMLAQAKNFTKKPAEKHVRGRNLSRSGSNAKMRSETTIFEPFRCDLTIEEGPLGLGVSRSKDEGYMLQFDYYTEKGNAEEHVSPCCNSSHNR